MSALRGTCLTLSSASEAREQRVAVRPFEDPSRGLPLVKAHSRSAAGNDVADPRDVRPLSVLEAAVEYLVGGGVHDGASVLSAHSLDAAHPFLLSRLRAVRADGAVQALGGDRWMGVLVACVRYHALCAYVLCGLQLGGGGGGGGGGPGSPSPSPSTHFLPHLNDERLADFLGAAWSVWQQEEGAVAARMTAGKGAGTPTRLERLAEEVAAHRLLLCLASAAPGPGEASARAAALVAGVPRALRRGALFRSALSIATAWTAERWSGVLAGAEGLSAAARGAGEGADDDDDDRARYLFLRCIAHRLVPSARARLVASLGTSIPSRSRVPLSAVTRWLRLRPGNGAEEVPSPSSRRPTQGAADDERPVSDPGWFSAAKLCVQMRHAVVADVAGGDGGEATATGAGAGAGGSLTAQDLLARRRRAVEEDWGAPPALALAAAPAASEGELFVVFSKAQGVADPLGLAAGGDLTMRVSLTPEREDGLVPLPWVQGGTAAETRRAWGRLVTACMAAGEGGRA
jgi:hypothetical protein